MAARSAQVVFQPRDIEILKAVYEHRFLTRGLILPLFGVDVSEEDTNLDRRLRKLAAGGYVRRLPRADRRSEFVYALTDRGAEFLKGHQLPLPFANWSEKNRVQADFVAHTLLTSRFYVSVVVGLRELTSVKLDYYERECRPRGRYDLLRSWQGPGGRTRKVNPDALLILAGEGIQPGSIFLESDNSTMKSSRMEHKFADYAAMYHEKLHHAFFDVPSFRVCTITKSAQRASNLLNLVLNLEEIRPEERRLFWFTTEDAYRAYPSNVFAAIWRSADGPHQLRALVGNPLPRRTRDDKQEDPSANGGVS